ncbi:MAG TPA: carboxypeptidase-like regulatory domain-containing protein, partial [Gemmatimonadales bacterium]|nr:carboxypeptidase-like regulatory domain-containing protein [Gemmatimonadales bacterium]
MLRPRHEGFRRGAVAARCSIAVSLVLTSPVRAQTGAVAGWVRSVSGVAIPNARVSVQNDSIGAARAAATDSSGAYRIAGLAPGTYQLSVSASGYHPATQDLVIDAGQTRSVNVTLADNLSLGDLGFTSLQTQGSAADQARLDKRSHMLKMHQRFGLLTAASFVATLISSTSAGGRRATTGGRNWHAGLGILNTGLYFTTAYFAIFAPKVPGTEAHG